MGTGKSWGNLQFKREPKAKEYSRKGAVMVVLDNFPYPANWLRNLAYCFWILTIILFILFILLSLSRLILYPTPARQTFHSFTKTSYLGAIPVSLDNITTGLLLHHGNSNSPAIWAAFTLWWLGVLLSVLLALVGVFAAGASANGRHNSGLSSVSGVWFLSVIPLIVTSAVGGTLIPYLPDWQAGGRMASTTLVVSFMILSLGVALSFLLYPLFFARIISSNSTTTTTTTTTSSSDKHPNPSSTVSRHTPSINNTPSTFILLGPLGMSGYSVQKLAAALAHSIRTNPTSFTITIRTPGPISPHDPTVTPADPSSLVAISQCIHWIAALAALCAVALGSCFLCWAVGSVVAKPPTRYSVGCWSVVFPVGVYTLAVAELGRGLRSEGFRGWGAVCGVLTVAVWAGNAACSFWEGVWRGKVLAGAGEEMPAPEVGNVEARSAEKRIGEGMQSYCGGSGSGNDGHDV
ncbi:MAG: hypothetical protein M1831_001345 [Alyxoria varia]|nr:MAG: hypothetical protein M1831_001345 [Alyxoria varia]